jgi:hypothetical protein
MPTRRRSTKRPSIARKESTTSAHSKGLSAPAHADPAKNDDRLSTADRAVLEGFRFSLAACKSQFKMKGNMKHHAYPANKAPYPRNYERAVIDQCVLYCILLSPQHSNQSPSQRCLGDWLHQTVVWKSDFSCLWDTSYKSVCLSTFSQDVLITALDLTSDAVRNSLPLAFVTDRGIYQLYRFWPLDTGVRKAMARELSISRRLKQDCSQSRIDAPSELRVCR